MLAFKLITLDLPLNSSTTKKGRRTDSSLSSSRFKTDPDLNDEPINRFKTAKLIDQFLAEGQIQEKQNYF
jgi:hypothetical protein